MALILNVPYSQKDEAKALGAKWNPDIKKWYIDNRKKYNQFTKWIDGNEIICDHIYIVEGIHTCFRCKSPTRVIGFGFESFYEKWDTQYEYEEDGNIHIGRILSKLPERLESELRKRYNYFWGYSKTTKSNDYGNHCQNSGCGVLQGNFFLFDEVDSPFFVDGDDSASKLTLHRIELKNDIAVTAEIGYGSEDKSIKRSATILNSDLNWE